MTDITEWQKVLDNPDLLEKWTMFWMENDPGFSVAWDYATMLKVTDVNRTIFAYAFAMFHRMELENLRQGYT